MKIINNKQELLNFATEDNAYDVDANWVIYEMKYKYPVIVECMGYDQKGCAYKVRDKSDLDELKKFLRLFS